tara:strand:- start:331 stop:531 length:201 start_codon:yes stop_codon:yes gene_type:complete
LEFSVRAGFSITDAYFLFHVNIFCEIPGLKTSHVSLSFYNKTRCRKLDNPAKCGGHSMPLFQHQAN